MRVVMIASQVPPAYGGAGQQALALSKKLVESGAEVSLLTGNQLGAPRSEMVDGVKVLRLRAGLPLVSGDGRTRSSEVFKSLWFCMWIISVLSRNRYDVIHVHGSYWYSVAAALLSKLRRIPLIVKVTRLGEDDAQTVATKQIKRVPIGKLYGFALANASVTISLSSEIRKRQKAYYPQTPTLEWPNGVDTEFFCRDESLKKSSRDRLGLNKKFAVLFVGYLAPHKGVGTLVRAWQEFVSDRNATLILAGPHSGFYRELDSDLVDFAKSAENVLVTGKVDRDELLQLYSAADLFVLPTKAEGMPNSLLEALATGLPAIATRVPGTIEIGENSTGIWWMAENTETELLKQLELAYEARNEPEFRGALGPEFSLDSVAERYLSLYESLLEPTGERNRRSNSRSN